MTGNMSSIDDLILQSANPFDRINICPGNFFADSQEVAKTVTSIHQSVIEDLTQRLEQVRQDHKSRSVLLLGDSGSGKSHLLSRLRQTLNDKAFFAYIGPWVDSQSIWRHILRYTIDSLMHIPQGQSKSQLVLWLKGLSAFTKQSGSLWGMLQSDRQKFINYLKKTYETAKIHNPDIFFGVLHDLTNPDRYDLACEWLRGDDLSEESLQLLRVKRCVESEEDAKNILANISKIAIDTLPIVLCFDQLDNIPVLENNYQDFQALFNVNTIIHNDGLKNFLVIISVIKDTWRRNQDRIHSADLARLEAKVELRQISLDQAEVLWVSQLEPLHQASLIPLPTPIFPLHRQLLEDAYPGGKTFPRNAILLGREKYQEYKMGLVNRIPQPRPTPKPKPPVITPPQSDRSTAEFLLKWQEERSQIEEKIDKLTARSSPELIQMLLETLSALEIKNTRLKALAGVYASYSMQYNDARYGGKVALVWTEDASMQSFYHVMKACQKAVNNSFSQLYLIRAESVGSPELVGHQIYRQIFTNSPHKHIKPSLASVHDLATYHSLVNATMAKELVLAGEVITLKELQALVRNTDVLHNCQLLRDLGVLKTLTNGGEGTIAPPLDSVRPLRDYILQTLTVQYFMGLNTLIQSTAQQFNQANQSAIETAIQQLCKEKRIQIMNPNEPPAKQLICWIPTN